MKKLQLLRIIFIGFETCLLFARNGILTYATMRDLMKADLIKDSCNKRKDS